MAYKNNNGDLEISSSEFNKFIENNKGKITVIDFFAEWCMPCLMIAPVIEELADKLHDKVAVAKMNVDDNSEIASKFHVMSIPTIIIFKEGKEIDRIVGSLPAEALEERILKNA